MFEFDSKFVNSEIERMNMMTLTETDIEKINHMGEVVNENKVRQAEIDKLNAKEEQIKDAIQLLNEFSLEKRKMYVSLVSELLATMCDELGNYNAICKLHELLYKLASNYKPHIPIMTEFENKKQLKILIMLYSTTQVEKIFSDERTKAAYERTVKEFISYEQFLNIVVDVVNAGRSWWLTNDVDNAKSILSDSKTYKELVENGTIKDSTAFVTAAVPLFKESRPEFGWNIWPQYQYRTGIIYDINTLIDKTDDAKLLRDLNEYNTIWKQLVPMAAQADSVGIPTDVIDKMKQNTVLTTCYSELFSIYGMRYRVRSNAKESLQEQIEKLNQYRSELEDQIERSHPMVNVYEQIVNRKSLLDELNKQYKTCNSLYDAVRMKAKIIIDTDKLKQMLE